MFFKIFLFLFSFINFINLLINIGRKTNLLSCGLGAYNGSDKPNELLLRIIGKYNEDRGVHSCGISSDYKIKNGVYTKKVFSDFVEDMDSLGEFKLTNNFILHTRKATVGAHTVENAHPFGFGGDPKSEEFDFIGAHNGSLIDWEELKEGIDPEIAKTLNIDSKVLLYRIFHDKNYKVLSQYKGAAALLFYNKKFPNRLYAFKGAAGKIEERPLYYVQLLRHKKPVGIYFSSMKEPFKFAGYSEKYIHSVPDNTLLEIENGAIIQRINISRSYDVSTVANTEYSNYNTRRGSTSSAAAGGSQNGAGFHQNRLSLPENRSSSGNSSRSSSSISGMPPSNGNSYRGSLGKASDRRKEVNEKFISAERFLHISQISKDRIIYSKLRYWRCGHLMEGINIINENGTILHYSPLDLKNIESVYNKLEQFQADPKVRNKTPKVYYFFMGVLFTDREMLEEFLNSDAREQISRNGSSAENTLLLSKYSKYPISPLSSGKKGTVSLSKSRVADYFLHKGRTVYSEKKFYPPFSMFCYCINQAGKLESISKLLLGSPYLSAIVKNISQCGENVISKGVKEVLMNTFNYSEVERSSFNPNQQISKEFENNSYEFIDETEGEVENFNKENSENLLLDVTLLNAEAILNAGFEILNFESNRINAATRMVYYKLHEDTMAFMLEKMKLLNKSNKIYLTGSRNQIIMDMLALAKNNTEK